MKSVLLLTLALCAYGCAMPQITEPYSVGFSKDEYIVIEIPTISHLGVLYYAKQELDEDGNRLPLRWENRLELLVPIGDGFNELEESDVNQSRKALQVVKSSAIITASALGELKASAETAFKYEAKINKLKSIKPAMNFYYNSRLLDKIRNMKKADPNSRFAYLSAIYEGSSYAEAYSKVDTSWKLFWRAAFKIDGSYYIEGKNSIANQGKALFRLTEFDPDLVGTRQGKVEKKLLPLTEKQEQSLSDGIRKLLYK